MTQALLQNSTTTLTNIGIPVFNMPIPDQWYDLAKSKGFALIARVRDRYHLALACKSCGRVAQHKLYTLRACQPQCRYRRFIEAGMPRQNSISPVWTELS